MPFNAFAGVERLSVTAPIEAESWSALGRWCPNITAIIIPAGHTARCCCFPPGTPGADRVAALKGLSQLTRLERLCFNVSNKLEVLALADAMQQMTRLTRLVVAVCPVAGLDWGCLLPLGKLASLASVSCTLRVPLASKHDAQMLLSAFAHVTSMALCVRAVDAAAVIQAVQESQAMALEVPGEVRVSSFPQAGAAIN